MSYDPDFDELFSETVTLTPPGSTDEMGDRTPGAGPKTVNSRSEALKGMTVFRDRNGRVLRGARRWFLKPIATDGSAITPTTASLLSLPAGYDPQSPRILGVHPVVDEDGGVHHWELVV